jgi:uncharacterized protein YndB with AHSA1/START domain
MSKRSVTHASFTIERTYDAKPARVFAAWTQPEAKARWFAGPDEWQKEKHQLDFRVGGRERAAGGPEGGPVHRYDATFLDIVPDERVVSVYDMHLDDVRISVSLATVEFKAAEKGTRLVYTEQGAFLDGYDDPAGREEGTHALLDKLGAELARSA